MFDIAIFTALGWERRAVIAGLAAVTPGERPRTWTGRLGDGARCLVVQTGIGPERARDAARSTPPASIFVACGCAGALVDWLQPGDLVVADRVLVLNRDGRPGDLVAAAGEPLAAAATALGF